MEIINRIVVFNNDVFKKILDEQSIHYDYNKDSLSKTIIIEINSKDSKWHIIEKYIDKYDLTVTPRVEYSLDEIRNAEWLVLSATGQFGYPQPENTYKESTYDKKDYCKECGIGLIQNRPFRLRSLPKQKHSHFLQLNWIFDEFFVKSNVKDVIEKNKMSGIKFSNPVLNKSNELIDSIFQLDILHILPPGLITENLQKVTCKNDNEESNIYINFPNLRRPNGPFCNRIKYHYPKDTTYKFSENCFKNAPDIVKSYEYFGSGAAADKIIIVSKKFYQLARENKWRGIKFEPITLV